MTRYFMASSGAGRKAFVDGSGSGEGWEARREDCGAEHNAVAARCISDETHASHPLVAFAG